MFLLPNKESIIFIVLPVHKMSQFQYFNDAINEPNLHQTKVDRKNQRLPTKRKCKNAIIDAWCQTSSQVMHLTLFKTSIFKYSWDHE